MEQTNAWTAATSTEPSPGAGAPRAVWLLRWVPILAVAVVALGILRFAAGFVGGMMISLAARGSSSIEQMMTMANIVTLMGLAVGALFWAAALVLLGMAIALAVLHRGRARVGAMLAIAAVVVKGAVDLVLQVLRMALPQLTASEGSPSGIMLTSSLISLGISVLCWIALIVSAVLIWRARRASTAAPIPAGRTQDLRGDDPAPGR